jgi:hypothetical protein
VGRERTRAGRKIQLHDFLLVAGNEPAAGKMPRPNRVRKPPGPHRRNILTALARGSKKPRRSEAKHYCEKAPRHHPEHEKAPPAGGAKSIAEAPVSPATFSRSILDRTPILPAAVAGTTAAIVAVMPRSWAIRRDWQCGAAVRRRGDRRWSRADNGHVFTTTLGETDIDLLRSRSWVKSFHAALPTLIEQNPLAIAANAFNTANVSSTNPAN